MANCPEILFNENELYTPNTYNSNFRKLPDTPGVYFITLPIIDEIKKELNHKILYIGSAKNLDQRYSRHEVLRLLNHFYGYVQFYFKETNNFREIEKQLIKYYQPEYNSQWR